MLAQKQDNPADGQRREQKVDTKVLGPVHVREEIVPCLDKRSNAARLKPKRAAPFMMVLAERWWDFLLGRLRFWF
jgi:hypothetical protein